MTLNSLLCADVPLRNYLVLTRSVPTARCDVYTVSQIICTVLFLQLLCQTRLFYDNFWQTYSWI